LTATAVPYTCSCSAPASRQRRTLTPPRRPLSSRQAPRDQSSTSAPSRAATLQEARRLPPVRWSIARRALHESSTSRCTPPPPPSNHKAGQAEARRLSRHRPQIAPHRHRGREGGSEKEGVRERARESERERERESQRESERVIESQRESV
jgi:hypothetical protein